MAQQQKQIKMPSGEIATVRWEVDISYIEQVFTWGKGKCRYDLTLAKKEIFEMEDHFPYFIATIAREKKIIYCPNCGDLIVWRNGLQCVACDTLFDPPANPQLAFVGQVFSKLGDELEGGSLTKDLSRPILFRIMERMVRAEQNGEGMEIFNAYIKKQGMSYYFIPKVQCFLPNNWNKNEPVIVLESDYFSVLELQPDHVFPGGSNDYRLCNYASWPRTTLCDTLQQRIVPRTIIDLMFADLKSLGKLNEVLHNLGTNLHSAYNFIGHGRKSIKFKEQYDRQIGQWRSS